MANYKVEEKVSKVEEIDLSKTYTYADYLRWEFDERLEIIKGKVFKMSPAPGSFHQRISQRVNVKLYNFLENKSCEVFTAPFDVRFHWRSNDDKAILTVLQPDICIVCDPAKIDKRGCIGAPDIVIEIISPGNNKKELLNKYEVYEEAGVLEYWILQPELKSFLKYTLDADGKFQSSRLLTVGDEVKSPVLPGFSLSLNEVFKD